VNATGDVIAPVDGTVVLVVAVGCDWYVLASKDFVTDGVEALVRKERAQTVNVGPGAGTVDSAGLRGAYVIVIAGGEVSKLTFNNTCARFKLGGKAKSVNGLANSLETCRVGGRSAGNGERGVYNTSSGCGRVDFVVTLVGVALVDGIVYGAAHWRRGTAKLSSRNSVGGTRRGRVARVGGLALSTSTETTACTTR